MSKKGKELVTIEVLITIHGFMFILIYLWNYFVYESIYSLPLQFYMLWWHSYRVIQVHKKCTKKTISLTIILLLLSNFIKHIVLKMYWNHRMVSWIDIGEGIAWWVLSHSRLTQGKRYKKDPPCKTAYCSPFLVWRQIKITNDYFQHSI